MRNLGHPAAPCSRSRSVPRDRSTGPPANVLNGLGSSPCAALNRPGPPHYRVHPPAFHRHRDVRRGRILRRRSVAVGAAGGPLADREPSICIRSPTTRSLERFWPSVSQVSSFSRPSIRMDDPLFRYWLAISAVRPTRVTSTNTGSSTQSPLGVRRRSLIAMPTSVTAVCVAVYFNSDVPRQIAHEDYPIETGHDRNPSHPPEVILDKCSLPAPSLAGVGDPCKASSAVNPRNQSQARRRPVPRRLRWRGR